MDATTRPPRENVGGASGSQDRGSHICDQARESRLSHIEDMRYAKGTLTCFVLCSFPFFSFFFFFNTFESYRGYEVR